MDKQKTNIYKILYKSHSCKNMIFVSNLNFSRRDDLQYYKVCFNMKLFNMCLYTSLHVWVATGGHLYLLKPVKMLNRGGTWF